MNGMTHDLTVTGANVCSTYNLLWWQTKLRNMVAPVLCVMVGNLHAQALTCSGMQGTVRVTVLQQGSGGHHAAALSMADEFVFVTVSIEDILPPSSDISNHNTALPSYNSPPTAVNGAVGTNSKTSDAGSTGAVDSHTLNQIDDHDLSSSSGIGSLSVA